MDESWGLGEESIRMRKEKKGDILDTQGKVMFSKCD